MLHHHRLIASHFGKRASILPLCPRGCAIHLGAACTLSLRQFRSNTTYNTMPKTALLIGGTGAVGKHVLRELLACDDFTSVIEAGRRVTPAEIIAEYKGKEKLKQKVIDFENLSEAKLKEDNIDVLLVTLGTSRAKAGGAEGFVRIDRTYPVEVAKAAKLSHKEQGLVYLSSSGASANSWFLYPKSKALTEQDLASTGYSTIAFRPALLINTERDEPRWVETVASSMTGFLSRFSPSLEIPVDLLARSMVFAARLGAANLPPTAESSVESPVGVPSYHVIGNKGAMATARV